jgi:hypothetical protein
MRAKGLPIQDSSYKIASSPAQSLGSPSFPRLGTPYMQASRVPSSRTSRSSSDSSRGELSPRATALSLGGLSPCVHDATPMPNDDPGVNAGV